MRLICLGDSVTRGVSYVRGRMRIVKTNYPALLQADLAGIPGLDVMNRGVFNDNSDGLLSRIERDVFAENADAVLVEIGGNDCNFRWDEVAQRPLASHDAVVPLERYIANLTRIVEMCRRAQITPVLLTILPLDPVRYYRHVSQQYGQSIAHWIGRCGGIEHWHGMYNRALKQLTQYLNVMSIDVRTGFKRSGDLADLLSEDGVHPTESGYKTLSRLVAAELGDLLMHSSSLVQPRTSIPEV